jgi:hypothetical protein
LENTTKKGTHGAVLEGDLEEVVTLLFSSLENVDGDLEEVVALLFSSLEDVAFELQIIIQIQNEQANIYIYIHSCVKYELTAIFLALRRGRRLNGTSFFRAITSWTFF